MQFGINNTHNVILIREREREREREKEKVITLHVPLMVACKKKLWLAHESSRSVFERLRVGLRQLCSKILLLCYSLILINFVAIMLISMLIMFTIVLVSHSVVIA